MEMDRDFKGVWIPREIWCNREISLTEKALLTEIESFDKNKGCYASNKYFAEFLDVSESKVKEALKHLRELGYVYTKNFDGRIRYLGVNVALIYQNRTKKQDSQNLAICPSENDRQDARQPESGWQKDEIWLAESRNPPSINIEDKNNNKNNPTTPLSPPSSSVADGGKPVDGKSAHGEHVVGNDGRWLEVEVQESICSFTENKEKEESAKAFGEQETEYRRNSTKPCHFGDVSENPCIVSDKEQKALKTANFGATVAEMETDRQKARKSLRRIFGNYPKRSQGIPISLFDLFYAERLWEVEADIINGISKWVKSSQWRKDCGRYIPAFQKFIEQEIWRYEPQEEEHKEVRADEVTATTENFEKFWAMFPDCRKIAKEKTIQTWNECGAEKVAGTILSQLAKDSKEQSWTKEGGKFSPSPRRYLVEKRWQDKLINGKTEEEHLRDIEEEKNRQFQERRKAFFERMGAKQCKF